MMDARFVFLERPAKLPMQRSRFEATYSKTLQDLERELKHLDARQVTIQAGFRQVRNDGWPYAAARPEHPACVLQFESRRRTLIFKASRFSTFEANLRSITLTLEALRAVDRYGVVEGEQYAGFKQIGDGQARPVAVSPLEAAAWVSSVSGGSPTTSILHNPYVRDEAYRKAARRLHPDNKETGNHEQFVKLQEMMRILNATSGASA
jgi:hypothetical protein